MAEQMTGPQAAKPRTYMDEYRRHVVDMVTGTDRTAMSVAAELGIHHTLLSRWMRRYGRTGQVSAPTPQAAQPSQFKPAPVPHADQVGPALGPTEPALGPTEPALGPTEAAEIARPRSRG